MFKLKIHVYFKIFFFFFNKTHSLFEFFVPAEREYFDLKSRKRVFSGIFLRRLKN